MRRDYYIFRDYSMLQAVRKCVLQGIRVLCQGMYQGMCSDVCQDMNC